MADRPGVPSRKPGLVLLAGMPFHLRIDPNHWEFIVAADGGATHALRQHLLPDHVIGDFDSLSPEERQRLAAAGVPMTQLPTAKDLTDGEAAVQWAIERYTTQVGDGAPIATDPAGVPVDIVISGGLGGRFDHALASITLLEQVAAAGLKGYMTDGRQQVFLLHDALNVAGEVGDLLSIIPLTTTVTGFSVSGVRWPLHDVTLSASSSLTLSNELTTPPARLWLREGRAVVVRVCRDELYRCPDGGTDS